MSQLSALMSPSVTTLNHEKERMGEDAGRMLIKLLNREDVQDINYEPDLVRRNSVVKPADATVDTKTE